MRAVADIPLLGWTREIDPRFADHDPLDVAWTAWRRVSPAHQALMRLDRQDVPGRAAMQAQIESRAEAVDDFTLLQIGAHDGEFDDPLRQHIDHYGWRAVLVEPQREPFRRLEALYSDQPNVTVVNSAVSDEAGTMTLWRARLEGSAAPFGEAIASTSPDQVVKEVKRCLGWRALRRAELASETVDVITVGDVFDIAGIDPEELDLVVCDTEGHDGRIVNALLDDAPVPPLLQYEHLHVPGSEVAALDARLLHEGMQLIRTHKDTLAHAA